MRTFHWSLVCSTLLISIACTEEDTTPAGLTLKFFNPNPVALDLLDSEERFLSILSPFDTTDILVDLDFEKSFSTRYESCLVTISDQFFIEDILILAPNYVTCETFQLEEPTPVNQEDYQLITLVINDQFPAGSNIILAQNTIEVVEIGNIDTASRKTLEEIHNFDLDTTTLVNYGAINDTTGHFWSMGPNYQLMPRLELACFVSQTAFCGYAEWINCTYNLPFVQFSRAGYSESGHQAIISFDANCCRGFSFFVKENGVYQLLFTQLLC